MSKGSKLKTIMFGIAYEPSESYDPFAHILPEFEKRIEQNDYSAYFEQFKDDESLTLIEAIIARTQNDPFFTISDDFRFVHLQELLGKIFNYVKSQPEPFDLITDGYFLNLAALTGKVEIFKEAVAFIEKKGKKINAFGSSEDVIIYEPLYAEIPDLCPLNIACFNGYQELCEYILNDDKYTSFYKYQSELGKDKSGKDRNFHPYQDAISDSARGSNLTQLNIIKKLLDKDIISSQKEFKVLSQSKFFKGCKLTKENLLSRVAELELVYSKQPTKRIAASKDMPWGRAFLVFLGLDRSIQYEQGYKYYQDNQEIIKEYIRATVASVWLSEETIAKTVNDTAQALFSANLQDGYLETYFYNALRNQKPELCKEFDKLFNSISNKFQNSKSSKVVQVIAISCLVIAGLCAGTLLAQHLPFGDKVTKLLTKTKIQNLNKILGGSAAASASFAALAVGVKKGYENYLEGKVGFLNRKFAEEAVEHCYQNIRQR